jgi:hypothetical protein
LRDRQESHGDLNHDAQHALGPGDQCQEIEPGAIQTAAPDGSQLALDRDQLHGEQVVDRKPVLQTVHAAGVFRDIAAD